MQIKTYVLLITGLLNLILVIPASFAQNAPSSFDYESYDQGFKAVHDGDIDQVKTLIKKGFPLDKRDGSKRTALHIAAYQSHDKILSLLAEAGGDINALEYMRYDVITIAAVANDIELMNLALKLGGNPSNITSLYDGTALIAAAHLGHDEVVKSLLEAGAPVNHVNNLGWTALIEAVVLGDGSKKYVRTVRHLLEHDADRNLPDRNGRTPLQLAKSHGYSEISKLLSN